jgi:endonuclease/exonuclease/phosphatase family metal-dependent hydrolase
MPPLLLVSVLPGRLGPMYCLGILSYMQKSLRVATWNIGGAHTVYSSNIFDYDQEDLAYFAEQLKKLNLDVICLQESHTNSKRVTSKLLAEMLGLPFVFDSPRSPSHISKGYKLANAIISRHPIEDTKHILLPQPPFELYFQNGKKAKLFQTYIQKVQIRGVTFANTHLQPLHLFGYSWSDGEGQKLARNTENVLLKNLRTTPLIFAGDFNAPNLLADFPLLTKSLLLKAALHEQPTETKGMKMDYILCSPEFEVKSSDVIKTDKSDHYLGWTELAAHDTHRLSLKD